MLQSWFFGGISGWFWIFLINSRRPKAYWLWDSRLIGCSRIRRSWCGLCHRFWEYWLKSSWRRLWRLSISCWQGGSWWIRHITIPRLVKSHHKTCSAYSPTTKTSSSIFTSFLILSTTLFLISLSTTTSFMEINSDHWIPSNARSYLQKTPALSFMDGQSQPVTFL